MSVSSSLAGAVFRFRQSGLGAFLAKSWQRLAPPITVTRRFYGVKVCVDLRDHAIWWASSARRVEESEGFDRMLLGVKGQVWDVGCNVGVFALYAASLGNKVTAFDISPKAIGLLKKSAARNGFDVNIVSQAFAVRTFHYTPPDNADTRNRPTEGDATAQHTSITFQEAEKRFGTPAFIKLDVEYAEVEFLKSAEFRDWIRSKQIPLLVELHEPHFWDLVWPDVPHLRFTESHVLFNPLPEMRTAVAANQSPA